MGFEAFPMLLAMALWASFPANGVVDTAERVDGLELHFYKGIAVRAQRVVLFHFFLGIRVASQLAAREAIFLVVYAGFKDATPVTVTVGGAHTLGVGHCRNFENRLRPRADPAISPSHAFVLKTIYSGPSVSDIAFATNDATATSFDNRYFIDTLNGRGLLKIDSDISRDPRTLSHVVRFGISLEQLFERFSYGFSKLSNYKALVGDVGKIRRDSRFSN
ncbi:peroxidase 21-like [Vitis vinifera]|uniref:peroxidase 21-like n=1 Tax=Vitis vinifera TaxID=29760 RepID=UPI0005402238|nr:peroxidase 21-like [Vitis vinifera]